MNHETLLSDFSICLGMALPLSGLAEMYGAEYQKCNGGTTVAIVDCIAARTKAWDKRLNTAYKDLSQRVDAGQREPLKAAQRLWIQYRDANCGFYGAAEGSIRQVNAAEYLRSMTEGGRSNWSRRPRASAVGMGVRPDKMHGNSSLYSRRTACRRICATPAGAQAAVLGK